MRKYTSCVLQPMPRTRRGNRAGLWWRSICPPAGKSSGALTVDGYVAHRIGAGEGGEIARDVAAAFTAVTTRPLAIQPQTVYPTLEHGGQTLMVGLGLFWRQS
ncbi:MAG: hypothetical protein IPK53_09740 [bacterium]|nr:hypothetical protein [bacterium]